MGYSLLGYQPSFTSRSLAPVANLTGEFAVNITGEQLSYILPANFDPDSWSMNFWFVPNWANTDGLRHIIAQIRLDDDNVVTIEKDAAGDLIMTYVAVTQITVMTRTVAFSAGTPVFVGVATDGFGNVAPSFNRKYTTIAADQNGDGSLEYTFKGPFGFPPDINRLAAGTYTLHVGSDFEFTHPLDGAVSIQITNTQDQAAIFDRFNGGDGLALVGNDSWIGRWCDYVVISVSAEANGNVRADTREGALDLMDVADPGTGKLVFDQVDEDYVEFGDTKVFDGLAAGTFFFDFENKNTSQGKILAGRFRLAGNNNRQWLASFAGLGELDFQINHDPSPGGENGNAHDQQRRAQLGQRICWVVTYDGSQPDDFGATGKVRFFWALYSSTGAIGVPFPAPLNNTRIWGPFEEVSTSDLSNNGTGPFPTTFKSAISATNYRWSSFDDQQVSEMTGDFHDFRFNLGRALDPEEILAMNPSEFVRSQWTHRWGMVLNAAGEVPDELGSGIDGTMETVGGDGPDEASDDRTFRHGIWPEVISEGGFAFDGIDDLILTSDPGDVADIELNRLSLPGDGSASGGNRIQTVHNAAFDVLVGDLDLRLDIRMDSFRDGPTQFNSEFLISKVDGGPNDRTWSWIKHQAGNQTLTIYDGAGTGFTFSQAEFFPLQLDGRRIWMRATVDLDDGAGNRVCRFYYSETWDGVSADDGSTWVLHETITQAGAIAALDPSPGSNIELGASSTNTFPRLRADVFRGQVRNGIEGTIVWDANFQAEAPGTTSFTEDANGLTVDLIQVGDPHVQITNGLQRVSWGWWGRIGRITAGPLETIFGRFDGADNQFRIARNGPDIRVEISSGGASESDFVDFTLGMKAGERWKFIVVYVGSGPYAYPQLDLPRGVRVTLYAYLFDDAIGQWGSRQTPLGVVTGILPQQLVPSALGYVWANSSFLGEVDETRVWNDVELGALEADQETVYQSTP